MDGVVLRPGEGEVLFDGRIVLKSGVHPVEIKERSVVLSDGSVAELHRDAPGYDLLGAFVGSEGTLGVATKIELRVVSAPEAVRTLPTYGADVAKNRAEARDIMQKLGYGPDKRLAVKVSTRDVQGYRDPAVIAELAAMNTQRDPASLQQLYFDAVRGRRPERSAWLTPV